MIARIAAAPVDIFKRKKRNMPNILLGNRLASPRNTAFAMSLSLGAICLPFAASAQMERPNPAKTGDIDLASDKADCESEGGTFFLAGLAKNHLCEHSVVDAGKVCSDNSQCSTRCLASRDSSVGSDSKGTCDPWKTTFGRCANTVKDGKIISPNICVD